MVELFVRLGVCLAMFVAGIVGVAPLNTAWQMALAGAALSFFAWRLEEKGVDNPGISGFLAVADAVVLAVFLRSVHLLDNLGFLVLVPCAYAAATRSSSLISMAPLASTALVGADSLNAKAGIPSAATLINAAGVLAFALVLGHRRPQSQPSIEEEGTRIPAPQVIEDGLLQVRESYRKLRDAYQDLETRARRDRVTARLAACAAGRLFHTEVCSAIKELTGAAEVAVHMVAQLERAMVVRGMTDDYPTSLRDEIVEVDLGRAPILIREHAEAAIRANASGLPVCSALLVDRGKVLGLISAVSTHPNNEAQLRSSLEEIAPSVAALVGSRLEEDSRTQRLQELELLYALSSVGIGAATPSALAARMVRELSGVLAVDSLAVVMLDGDQEIVLAKHGNRLSLVDAMSFAEGPGLKGWIATGSPELYLFDSRQDDRCDPRESLTRRIGSYYQVPLWAGLEPLGYVCAATHVAGGIDRTSAATLRIAALELCRALERVHGSTQGGLMTPKEFALVTNSKPGCLVYLEPLRREQIVSSYGRAAYDAAVRRLANQIRAQLPPDAALCRRDENDFVVFLNSDEEFARRWANDVAAAACLIGVEAAELGKRIPLALRAKVAEIHTQSSEVSTEFAA